MPNTQIVMGPDIYVNSQFVLDFPVYHTAFDSYNWMRNFGDPFFQRHMAG